LLCVLDDLALPLPSLLCLPLSAICEEVGLKVDGIGLVEQVCETGLPPGN
jgi:hypothetical protein